MATMGINTVTPAGNNAIDSLLTGVGWSTQNISYSFPTDATNFVDNYSTTMEQQKSFLPLSSAMQAGIRQALSLWASVANLTFTEVPDSTTYGVLRFGQTSGTSTAHAYDPYTSERGGDVWFGYKETYTNPQWQTFSNYDFETMVHEIGHALGLKHPGNYNGDGTGDPPFADSSIDCMAYTLMSYHSYPGSDISKVGAASTSYPQSPMLDDIAAIQYIYGANYTTGNITYSFNPNDAKIFRTIWGGSGGDIYDASAYTTGVDLELAPGAWSQLESSQLADLGDDKKAPGNVVNAYLYNNDPRSLIANAIGGSGDDTLRGNAGSNSLSGGAGNDGLWGGGGGNDTLVGGSGADMFWWTSGEGNNVVVSSGQGSVLQLYAYAYADHNYSISANGDMVIGKNNGSDNITVSNWENQVFTDRIQSFVFSDNGVKTAYAYNGGQAINVDLSSTAYRDTSATSLKCVDTSNAKLGGSTGNDAIWGGIGSDSLWGGNGGNDMLIGGAGSDSYWFGVNDGADTIVADATNNQDTVMFYGPGFGTGGIASTVVSNNNLKITLVQGASLTLQDWGVGGGYRLNQFNFETGSMAGTYSLDIASDNQTPTWTKLS